MRVRQDHAQLARRRANCFDAGLEGLESLRTVIAVIVCYGRSIFLTGFLLLVFSSGAAASSGSGSLVEITVLDAKYADAFVIRSPEGRYVLLDAGDVKEPDLVADHLKAKQVETVDLMILSHPHKNHFGAAFRVLEEFPVREIIWNGDSRQEEPFAGLLERAREKKIPVRAVRAGERFAAGKELEFEVLHPGEVMGPDMNDNALVLRMRYQDVSVLFTADIGPLVQEALIEKWGAAFSSEIVQVPHHGGPFSERFIEFFEPDFFILSTGPNAWGLPVEEDIQRLKGKVLRTDLHGTLVLLSDGKSVWPQRESREASRFQEKVPDKAR